MTATAKRRQPPRSYRGKQLSGLAAKRAALGYTAKDMAARIPADRRIIDLLEKGGAVPKNHPWLPRIAELYEVPVEELAPQLSDAELPGAQVERLRKQLVAKPRKATAPGTAIVRVKAPGEKPTTQRGPYNKLKKLPKDARQVARGLIEVLNLNALKGNRFVELRAVPLGPLGEILTDYLKMKGIDAPMILAPDFTEYFD